MGTQEQEQLQPGTRAPSGLQRLKSEHLKMVELALGGLSRTAIAQAMNYTPEGVGLIMHSPLFQQELGRRRSQLEKKMDQEHVGTISEAKKLLADSALRAVEVHTEIMDSAQSTPADRQRSADSILKQIFGGEKTSGGQGSTNVVVLEPGAIQLLQVALQESEDKR